MKKFATAALLLPFMLWLIFLIIVPLFLIGYYGLTAKDAEGVLHFSLENFSKFLEPFYINVLVRSLWLSFISTVLCLLIGYPVALILASDSFRHGSRWLLLLIAPMWMNFLLRTYAWLTLLERSGVINSVLGALGFESIVFLGNEKAVVFGMVYNFLPYMILPLYNSISKIPKNIFEAAHDLGANDARCFGKIVLPLSLPGIISGITMVFVPGVTAFVITQFLGSGNVTMIGDIIEQQFLKANNWGFGAAISIIVMVVVVLCMWLVNKFSDQSEVTLP